MGSVLNDDRSEKLRRERKDLPPPASRQKSFQALITLYPCNGFIAAGSSCTVTVTCNVATQGWHHFLVVVRNLKRDHHNMSLQKDHALMIKHALCPLAPFTCTRTHPLYLRSSSAICARLSNAHAHHVASSHRASRVTFRVQVVHPPISLSFPDTRGTNQQRELCFGLCYIDYNPPELLPSSSTGSVGGATPTNRPRRFLKKQPFRITNLQTTAYTLSVTSNLTKQAFIFKDEGCEVLTELIRPRGE